MTANAFAEILTAGTSPQLFESGGGHGQKGIEFQRYWAIMRMFELDDAGVSDFLLLFEVIQDIAILNSESEPTGIKIYQLKKKDRGEWSWSQLTALSAPPKEAKSSRHGKMPKVQSKRKPITTIKDSPMGKLYTAVRAFNKFDSVGHFVSNVACDIPLAVGSAATTLSVPLSSLSKEHSKIIKSALSTLHNPGEPDPDLSRLFLVQVNIPVDDPRTYLVGVVHRFLQRRSPRHAGQAEALVDALLVKISPLGSKTKSCTTFEDIRRERGYSRSEFQAALGELESIPDIAELLQVWMLQLQTEGMGFAAVTSIKAAAAGILRRQVMGVSSIQERQILEDCDEIIETLGDSPSLLRRFEYAQTALSQKHSDCRPAELLAHFALRAVGRCVAQI